MTTPADIDFYWDPGCPFAWLTSRWVVQVAARRDHRVEWRLISLRELNAARESDTPERFRSAHRAGHRILRVAAAARAGHGSDALGPLYTAIGEQVWDVPAPGGDELPLNEQNAERLASTALERAGLPTSLMAAFGDDTWDVELRRETEHALSLTGPDVGTPIIQFRPPYGPAFFGPVISRVPDGPAAVELWDHVIALATFPGFAELKRSLRETPNLRAFDTG